MPPQRTDSWSTFERTVAELYRLLGAERVQENANLAGTQIDVYVEEKTKSGQIIRTAVECKYYQRRVPKDVVLSFVSVANFLKQTGKIDKATVVGYQGFTQDAFLAAQAAQVDLVTFADLEHRVIEASGEKPERYFGSQALIFGPIAKIIKQAEQEVLPESFPDSVFVLMPFLDELEDTYVYGIRGAAEKLGLKCSRADEIEHNHEIIKEVVDNIKRAKFVIAELTNRNANVFYELGWAHALEREPILIARQGTELPFDVAHVNTIFYRNLSDLETKLTARLRAMLG
jgi:Restriction endonuclease